jgi:molybdopterin synthase catalytic subunit
VILLTRGPIDAEALRRAVAGPANGAVVLFYGDAREATAGRRVLELVYEAYEAMALAALGDLAQELRARHGLSAVACAHRLGRVPVGESALVLAVSAPHREAALAAMGEFIRRLKQDVPIWKQERFEDGAVWVGSAADPQAVEDAARSTRSAQVPGAGGRA